MSSIKLAKIIPGDGSLLKAAAPLIVVLMSMSPLAEADAKDHGFSPDPLYTASPMGFMAK
jgi:hypothetical protein